MLKSVPSADVSYISFVNHSNKNADVVWFDFDGNMRRFNVLQPTQTLDINTFKGHPWKTFDNDTGQELLVNGNSVYHPVSVREMHQNLQPGAARTRMCRRLEVVITEPMHTLLDLCLRFIGEKVRNKDNVETLDLPEVLKRSLRNFFIRMEKYRTSVS